MRGLGIAGAATVLFASSVVADLDPIEIKGSKFFFKSNGTQFFIQGVAYQQDVNSNGTISAGNTHYRDPLADADACRRDVPYLKQLNTNTIRVYAIDPTQDHSACMQLLQANGIYVIADLSQPNESINRDDPAWTVDLYQRYTSVVDVFASYSNVLGFFAGNEVSNQANNTAATAFVKAAVRDTKAYIASKNYRKIGVGYAANDDQEIVLNLANYLNCGSDTSASIDFFGYNIYSWCGDSSFEASHYQEHTEQYANYSVPVFFAEYGCNRDKPRRFTDVPVLFGEQMTPVWSGGVLYMYFQEANDYGLVSVSGNTVSTLIDFENYSSQMATIAPSGVNSNSYNPTNTVPRDCPAVAATWRAEASPLPPSANPAVCDCMMQTLGCTVKSSTNEQNYGQLFGTVCGFNNGAACAGIAHNASTGSYGAFGMCNATEQLAFAFNQYYLGQKAAASACDFDGAAQTRASATPSGACKSLLSQAGSAGTGTVTSAPTGAGARGSASSTKGAAGAVTVPSLDLGMLQLGAYVLCAALTGAGMILL